MTSRMLLASDSLMIFSATVRSLPCTSRQCRGGDELTMSALHGPCHGAGYRPALEMVVQSLIVGAKRQGAEDGDREQVRHRRDGVVDAGSDARLMRRHGIDDGRGQRRDAHHHADAEDRDRAEKGPIRSAADRQGQQSEAESGDRRPDHQRPAGAEAVEHAARPARQGAHDERERQEGGAGERGGKARDLNERKRQKEEGAAERGIEEQGQHIDGAEGARAEQPERQHRVAAVRLLPNEDRHEQQACRQRQQHRRVAPAGDRRRNEAIGETSQRGECQQRAAPIQPALGLGVAAFRHMSERNPDRRQREQRVDEKNPAPAEMIDDRAAEERADGAGDRGKSGPGPDRLAALGFIECRSDDRQRARDQQRRPDALNRARQNELRRAGRQSARQ